MRVNFSLYLQSEGVITYELFYSCELESENVEFAQERGIGQLESISVWEMKNTICEWRKEEQKLS